MIWAHDCHVCNQEVHQYDAVGLPLKGGLGGAGLDAGGILAVVAEHQKGPVLDRFTAKEIRDLIAFLASLN